MKENKGEKENRQIVELLSGQSAPYVEIEQKRKDGFRSFGIVIALSLCVLLAVYFICGYFVENMEKEDIPVQTDLSKEETDEWAGAFLSREISEVCLDVSVRIRLGAAGEYGARGASGVVIDRGGWIATSNSVLDGGQKGRIYVLLSDGREYAVEKIVSDRESGAAFMKIDTDDLRAVLLDSSVSVCLGQRVLALSSDGAPEHNTVLSEGIVSEIKKNTVRTDIELTALGAGCPVFDERGNFLGLWLFDGGNIISTKELSEIFERLKEK